MSNDVSSNRVPKKVSRCYRQPPSPEVLHSESCLPLRFLKHHQSLICSSGWWFGTFYIFQNIWDVILPIDLLIFFKMVQTC